MTTHIEHRAVRVLERLSSPRISAGGAMILLVGGIAGILLGFLGLINLLSPSWDGLGLVTLGCCLILAGGLLGMAAATADIPSAPGVRGRSAGFTTELVLGLISVVLGILVISDATTINLMAIGVITLGMALWMGSLDVELFERSVPRPETRVRNVLLNRTWGLDVVFGMLAVTLGILAWMGLAVRGLPLIAETIVGIAVLILGAVLLRGRNRTA